MKLMFVVMTQLSGFLEANLRHSNKVRRDVTDSVACYLGHSLYNLIIQKKTTCYRFI